LENMTETEIARKIPARIYACHVDENGVCTNKSENETHFVTGNQGGCGLLIPVEGAEYDFIFVGQDAQNKPRKPQGLNDTVKGQLVKAMEKLQRELKLALDGTNLAAFISMAPKEEVFRLWIDSKRTEKGKTDADYCIFDDKWKAKFATEAKSHMDSMRELCQKIDIETQWKEFFDTFPLIDYALQELQTIRLHTPVVSLVDKEMKSRQERYEKMKKEYLPALYAVKQEFDQTAVIDRERFIELAKEWIDSGMELDTDAVEFLTSELCGDGNPLSAFDHTFCLPKDCATSANARKGPLRKMSREELDRKYQEGLEKRRAFESEARLIKELLSAQKQ